VLTNAGQHLLFTPRIVSRKSGRDLNHPQLTGNPRPVIQEADNIGIQAVNLASPFIELPDFVSDSVVLAHCYPSKAAKKHKSRNLLGSGLRFLLMCDCYFCIRNTPPASPLPVKK